MTDSPMEVARTTWATYRQVVGETSAIKKLRGWSSPEGRRARGRECRSQVRHDEAKKACRLDLAQRRGWLVTSSSFGIRALSIGSSRGRAGHDYTCHHPIIDHAEHFRETVRPYRPAAILSHSYETDREAHEAFAREHDLHVEFLPDSWYWPGDGGTLAALYTRGPYKRARAVHLDLRDVGDGLYQIYTHDGLVHTIAISLREAVDYIEEAEMYAESEYDDISLDATETIHGTRCTQNYLSMTWD